MKPVSASLPIIKRNQTAKPGESSIYGKAQVNGNGSSIGAILVDTGRLSAENADRVLRLQIEQGKRFGDTAIELGLLTEDDVRFALSRQFNNLYLPAGDNSLSYQLVAAYKPFSPIVEKLRALRSQLMLRWFDSDARLNSLAIMSPGIGEGRSFIAANLAVVFSQLGKRTLLIDANLRAPRQHELFKLGNNAGLSSMLAGRIGIEAIARVPSLLGLSVLPAGAVPPNPQELLGRTGFPELLQSVVRDFDVVIIDTPAAHEYAEAQIIAARASAALIVARKDRTSVPQTIELVRSLQQTGTTPVGSVLNEF
ncbi:chain length determinant protein tyrosine kinase EpsG [Nitrosospira sp. Nsp11]|uniref:chain length determinant protein tyrosine kinase EpsG n=1 Tax=Nitrosospira sp. Nsp11 TaxID=1855338 RepID=UPI000922F1A3|nr:chain length determinant protein tyrosine kinase EpsG [Nitrosospira sp. Nsp11]SHM00548.1 chain length determinant protein tyrosine kinase EpsG [Nitrosospira sp. Nsp11]